MKTIFVTICTFFVLNTFAQTAQEIAKKSNDAVEAGDMEMISGIYIYDAKGNLRTRQISTASKKFADCTKMLIRFMAPADVKGTSLLVYDYDNQSDHQWIYIIRIRNLSVNKKNNWTNVCNIGSDHLYLFFVSFSYSLCPGRFGGIFYFSDLTVCFFKSL